MLSYSFFPQYYIAVSPVYLCLLNGTPVSFSMRMFLQYPSANLSSNHSSLSHSYCTSVIHYTVLTDFIHIHTHTHTQNPIPELYQSHSFDSPALFTKYHFGKRICFTTRQPHLFLTEFFIYFMCYLC